jgi:tRNA (uracil-5-)-methyltransferase TRM9
MKIQDVLVPWVLKAKAGEEDIIHHRYYHLFIKGELREMVLEAAKAEGYRTPDEDEGGNGGSAGEEDYGGSGDEAWLRVRGEGWEADNWWIEAEVGKGPYRPERP